MRSFFRYKEQPIPLEEAARFLRRGAMPLMARTLWRRIPSHPRFVRRAPDTEIAVKAYYKSLTDGLIFITLSLSDPANHRRWLGEALSERLIPSLFGFIVHHQDITPASRPPFFGEIMEYVPFIFNKTLEGLKTGNHVIHRAIRKSLALIRRDKRFDVDSIPALGHLNADPDISTVLQGARDFLNKSEDLIAARETFTHAKGPWCVYPPVGLQIISFHSADGTYNGSSVM
jgi:hypothetical protein